MGKYNSYLYGVMRQTEKVYKFKGMVTFSEMNFLLYSLPHDFHVICTQFIDGVIDKEIDTKELGRTIKTFQYKNTRTGIKCCNH